MKALLPAARPLGLVGDELGNDARLLHFFRDSYSAAQGRQWLQAYVLWWGLLFLRRNGVTPDWDTIDSPALARKVTTAALPTGHTTVDPADQTVLNFGLWWRLARSFARAVYCYDDAPPNPLQVEDHAHRLGLRPWMSSATYEELAGIGRALDTIRARHSWAHNDPDDFLVRLVLPGLITTDLYWLHAPGGRPGRQRRRVVLRQRYDQALTKAAGNRVLTPLDHMYLRAGDILAHLAVTPDVLAHPHLRRVAELAAELDRACGDPPARLVVGGAS